MFLKTINISVLTLFVFTAYVFSEELCKTEMDVYGKTQTITSNLLNEINNPSRLMEITDYYGEQTVIANALIKEGKYQEACNVYQGVIDKYNFKTIEEQYFEKHPEKKPEQQNNPEKSSSSSTSADSSAADTEASGSASGAAAN